MSLFPLMHRSSAVPVASDPSPEWSALPEHAIENVADFFIFLSPCVALLASSSC